MKVASALPMQTQGISGCAYGLHAYTCQNPLRSAHSPSFSAPVREEFGQRMEEEKSGRATWEGGDGNRGSWGSKRGYWNLLIPIRRF